MSAGYGGSRFLLPRRRVIYYIKEKRKNIHISAGYGGSRFRLPRRRVIYYIKEQRKNIHMSAGYGGSCFRLPCRRAYLSRSLSLPLSRSDDKAQRRRRTVCRGGLLSALLTD